MKHFILTTVILLQLIFFAACDFSKYPRVSTISPAASTATITASPNSVSASEGVGITTITWDTGDGTAGQVYVSVDSGPEAVFAGGPSGSAPAQWIQVGRTYDFRLYAGTEHTTVLAKTQVTAHK